MLGSHDDWRYHGISMGKDVGKEIIEEEKEE